MEKTELNHKLPVGKVLILFDGVCNLCNSTVDFVIKRDHHDHYRFASLQSPLGQAILKKHDLLDSPLSSIILYDGLAITTQSTAAIRIVEGLGGLYRFCGLWIIFPKWFRDGIYSWIAKNRYWWFGKKTYCAIPTKEISAKFLEARPHPLDIKSAGR